MNRQIWILIFSAVLPFSAAGSNDFYTGIRATHEHVDMKHSKDVLYNAGVLQAHPDGTYVATHDRDSEGIYSLSAALGYRMAFTERTWLSTELEGSIYSGTVRGELDGTYQGDAIPIPSEQVFPGEWKARKDHSLGINARLAYDLDLHRTVYLLAGVQWLEASFHSSYDNYGSGVAQIKGETRKTRSVKPWLIGAGMEFGNGARKYDVRIHYSEWNTDFSAGDGLTEESALVGYDFDVEEVGISLGYVHLF